MNKLEDFGFIQSRPRGEYHANNQQMSKLLHKAIGLGNKGSAPQVGIPCLQEQMLSHDYADWFTLQIVLQLSVRKLAFSCAYRTACMLPATPS